MLVLKKKQSRPVLRVFITLAVLILLGGGLYAMTLVAAPMVPAIAIKPIDVRQLPEPKPADNRIIIAKIGVNIPYGTDGRAALDRGAEWRYPERGNPKDGGNFIIAAHRFTIQPTPQATIEKSPFFHIDKLAMGDKIIVDYSGVRYGYEIIELKNVDASQTEIEAKTEDSRLTLYSCELNGEKSGRVVVIGKLLGRVAIKR